MKEKGEGGGESIVAFSSSPPSNPILHLYFWERRGRLRLTKIPTSKDDDDAIHHRRDFFSLSLCCPYSCQEKIEREKQWREEGRGEERQLLISALLFLISPVSNSCSQKKGIFSPPPSLSTSLPCRPDQRVSRDHLHK